MIPAVAIHFFVGGNVIDNLRKLIDILHWLEQFRLKLRICTLRYHHCKSAFTVGIQETSCVPKISILQHLQGPAIDDLRISTVANSIDRMYLLAMEAEHLADCIATPFQRFEAALVFDIEVAIDFQIALNSPRSLIL